jgi:hypothetical protein
MSVENDGASRTGCLYLAENHGIPSWDRHQLGSDAALLQHARDRLSVALDIRVVGGNVGYCKQRDKLVDNDAFVLLTPLPGGKRSGIQGRKDLSSEARYENAQHKDGSFHTLQYLTLSSPPPRANVDS